MAFRKKVISMQIIAQCEKESQTVFHRLEFSKNKSNNVESTRDIEGYKKYVQELKNKLIVFSDEENPGKGIVINQYYKSRYSKHGRMGVGRRIRSGADYHVEKGVFLTLTYAHTITADQAWGGLSADIQRITNLIKIYVKREAKKEEREVPDLQYFWVIEAQGNGYPHLHIFYADIDYLLDKNTIRRLWGRGFIKVKKVERINIGKYMSKYLTKQDFKDSTRVDMVMFYVWKYHIRLYGFSKRFRPVRDPMEKRYKLLGFCTLIYGGDPDVPDLQTFLSSTGLSEVAFWWGGGGGITLKVQKGEKLFFKANNEIPF